MTEPIPSAAYIRVSTFREEMVSPELQKAAIEDKAARDGAAIADGHWIEELDVSGRGFGRKGVQEAIRLVRAGVVQRVYVWRYSRFGRNATLVGLHVGQMEEAGGQLVSATEETNHRTAAGKFARGVMWQVDEFYSNVIGEQWQEAHARRRRNGLPHNGAGRFGYAYHHPSLKGCPRGCAPGCCETGYVPDTETEEAARGMYEAYNAGTSVLKIAVALNGAGHLTGTGTPWQQRSVRRYMDSGFAAGFLRIHDPACDCGRTACKQKVLVPGAHEAIISEQAWEEYLAQRAARRYLPPRVETPRYPLAGLVACGRCGGPLNAHSHMYHGVKVPGYLYQCARYMRDRRCKGVWITRHRVEDVVVAWLNETAGEAGRRAEARRGTVRARARADSGRRRLAAQVARNERALTELTVQLARGVVPEDAYVPARDELLESRGQLERALAAQAAERVAEVPEKVAGELAREWVTLAPEVRQRLLATLVRVITVTPGEAKYRARVSITSAWGKVYDYDI